MLKKPLPLSNKTAKDNRLDLKFNTMTEIDLKIQLALAEKDYQYQKNEIIKRFCNANNPYKIGDVFTDHMGSIRIEKIGYSATLGHYCCTYDGVILRKDGTETKNKDTRTAWQSNEIKTA